MVSEELEKVMVEESSLHSSPWVHLISMQRSHFGGINQHWNLISQLDLWEKNPSFLNSKKEVSTKAKVNYVNFVKGFVFHPHQPPLPLYP
jgi:hypothetical protein